MSRSQRWLMSALSVVMATALWLPALHLFFRPDLPAHTPEGALSPTGEALLGRQLALFEDSNERAQVLERMRASNAEWDFMGRTFLVLALGNMALRRPTDLPR